MNTYRKQRREKGQSLVEMALILPLLLILLAGVIDVARLYYVYVVLTDAAAEGVSYAAVNPPTDPSDLEDPDTAQIRARTLSACTGVDEGVQSCQCFLYIVVVFDPQVVPLRGSLPRLVVGFNPLPAASHDLLLPSIQCGHILLQASHPSPVAGIEQIAEGVAQQIR